ncbi:MAG: SpoIIE family protein phosphatase [Lachnospiraceae bacterium]
MDYKSLVYSVHHIEKEAGVLGELADLYDKITKEADALNEAAPFTMQLKEISKLLLEYTGVFSKELMIPEEMVSRITDVLQKKGITAKDLKLIERGDGHKELYVKLCSVRKQSANLKEITGIFSEIFQTFFDSSDNNRVMINGNFNEYVFEECGRFEYSYGAASRNKQNNPVSGDSYIIEQVRAGKIMMSLCDGMGTGRQAFNDSSKVIELMELALKSGFSEHMAIELINQAVEVSISINNPITIDLCTFDTFLGLAGFMKMGAAATFIKRKDWVEVIQSETLPIGVLNHVDFDCTMKKMYDGDYVIMVSDGVLDELPVIAKEKMLMEIISKIQTKNPQSIAEEIINKVLTRGNDEGEPNDDMTVLVMGIFSRR